MQRKEIKKKLREIRRKRQELEKALDNTYVTEVNLFKSLVGTTKSN